jgi:hypothetical protein
MGPALAWLDTARQCFAADDDRLRRGLLTSVFALLVGLERIWHLDEMEDVGFAVLSGGRRCPSRYAVGAWRRHLPWYEVDAFCRRTSPWDLIRGDVALVSYDEHTIPRWTRKFHIQKGYVTTRNRLCNALRENGNLGKVGSCLSSPATPFQQLRCKAPRSWRRRPRPSCRSSASRAC